MWISRQMIAAGKQRPAGEMAAVTGGESMQGASSYRGVPLAGPWGVAYAPPNGTQSVLVGTGTGTACIGTLTERKNLAPGELLLFSSGGAEIYLKNSGEVVINGQIFAAKKEG